MKALILAGGGGTRLWPLSRKNYPKQFLKLHGDKSLLRQTVERLSKAISPDNLIVITNSDYKFYVKDDLSELSHVILEPEGRNTAPAIILGIKYCLETLGCSEDEVLFVCPSDHIIRPADAFTDYIHRAEEVAQQGHIVTFGITPHKPEAGYGYIKAKGTVPDLRTERSGVVESGLSPDKVPVLSTQHFLRVERFIEKPDTETAQRYLNEGGYYWNSGMFAFTIQTMLKEMQTHAPDIMRMMAMPFTEMHARFKEMPSISLDYAVMEKADNVGIIPLELSWNDIGSWDALYEVLDKDEEGNITVGDSLCIDTKNTLLIGNKRLISTVGLQDCLIVECDDAILIAKRGQAQKVREVVSRLKELKRREAEEHVTVYRPWGSYTVLEEGTRYKIKRIVVSPSAKLSLQLHHHRSEHWVVVKGAAKVSIDGREIFIHENESAYVPKSTLHRLENPGKVPLEIIEVQNGEYVGEDDIQRMDDEYGREKDRGRQSER